MSVELRVIGTASTLESGPVMVYEAGGIFYCAPERGPKAPSGVPMGLRRAPYGTVIQAQRGGA